MPDIAMCMNDACPSAKACYRHEATPNPWRQSWATFRPDETGKCENFTPIKVEADAQTGEVK